MLQKTAIFALFISLLSNANTLKEEKQKAGSPSVRHLSSCMSIFRYDGEFSILKNKGGDLLLLDRTGIFKLKPAKSVKSQQGNLATDWENSTFKLTAKGAVSLTDKDGNVVINPKTIFRWSQEYGFYFVAKDGRKIPIDPGNGKGTMAFVEQKYLRKTPYSFSLRGQTYVIQGPTFDEKGLSDLDWQGTYKQYEDKLNNAEANLQNEVKRIEALKEEEQSRPIPSFWASWNGATGPDHKKLVELEFQQIEVKNLLSDLTYQRRLDEAVGRKRELKLKGRTSQVDLVQSLDDESRKVFIDYIASELPTFKENIKKDKINFWNSWAIRNEFALKACEKVENETVQKEASEILKFLPRMKGKPSNNQEVEAVE